MDSAKWKRERKIVGKKCQSLAFEGVADGVGEPVRRLHDDVDAELAPLDLDAGLLFLQLADGGAHAQFRSACATPGRPLRTRSTVADAEACLEGDVLDQKLVRHRGSVLMVF